MNFILKLLASLALFNGLSTVWVTSLAFKLHVEIDRESSPIDISHKTQENKVPVVLKCPENKEIIIFQSQDIEERKIIYNQIHRNYEEGDYPGIYKNGVYGPTGKANICEGIQKYDAVTSQGFPFLEVYMHNYTLDQKKYLFYTKNRKGIFYYNETYTS